MKKLERYEYVVALAAFLAIGCFSLILLPSLGMVANLRVAGLFLWPVVMATLITSIFVASWASAKSKGRSGWLGIALPLLDVFGLTALFRLKDKRGGQAK